MIFKNDDDKVVGVKEEESVWAEKRLAGLVLCVIYDNAGW